MTKISVKVNGSSLTASADGKLTSGMVGVVVSIDYDNSWDNLIKTASFRVGSFVRSRRNIQNSTTVPWEVMRHHGKPLEVGVEGRDEDGNIVIPTVWAVVGTVYEGAVRGINGSSNLDDGGGDDASSEAVLYVKQNLSKEQKAQARENIGAAAVGEGGGGSSVQSDWNQTDETAADFIKNKPFGETPTVLYEGTDLAPMESDGVYMLFLPVFEVIENQSYSVVIDGVKYETKGGLVHGIVPFIGNPALVEAGEDDGSPYVCMLDVETQEHMIFAMAAPFTSIRITTNTIQKMEQKYLPFGEIVLGYDYYKGGNTKYLCNGDTEASNVVTFSELKGLYRTGRTVYVRHGSNRYLPIMANTEGLDNYGFLAIIKEDGSLERFYTAEYTPET